MFNPHMNAFLQDASIDKFVHTNTDSRLGHIKDNASTPMVMLVRHTLVNGRVGEDVNVVADLDWEKVLREVGHAMLPELLREHVARTRSGTE